jgi:hypothetical protein
MAEQEQDQEQEQEDQGQEEQEQEGPRVHTSPEEGHPAGEGDRSDRDIGGPTGGEGGGEETGGAAGTKPDAVFEPHEDADDHREGEEDV